MYSDLERGYVAHLVLCVWSNDVSAPLDEHDGGTSQGGITLIELAGEIFVRPV